MVILGMLSQQALGSTHRSSELRNFLGPYVRKTAATTAIIAISRRETTIKLVPCEKRDLIFPVTDFGYIRDTSLAELSGLTTYSDVSSDASPMTFFTIALEGSISCESNGGPSDI